MMNCTRTSTQQGRSGQITLHGPEAFAGHAQGRAADRRGARSSGPASSSRASPPRRSTSSSPNSPAITRRVPASLNYRGYPKSICTSINHVVCHGIPNDKPLREGDIVNIDVTLIVDGWHGDASRMYPVGEVNRKAERLIEVTYEALMRGIAAVKPGNTHRRYRPRHPDLCRRRALLGGARFLRPWPRPRVPRPSQHPALRPRRRRRRRSSPACSSPSSR